MSQEVLFDQASVTSNTEGTPVNLSGAEQSLEMTADAYGTDGKFVVKASADGTKFTTLGDTSVGTGLAEYTSDQIKVIGKLGIGWQLRVDFEISAGTATNVKAITNRQQRKRGRR